MKKNPTLIENFEIFSTTRVIAIQKNGKDASLRIKPTIIMRR